jgi:hypothetical protein
VRLVILVGLLGGLLVGACGGHAPPVAAPAPDNAAPPPRDESPPPPATDPVPILGPLR